MAHDTPTDSSQQPEPAAATTEFPHRLPGSAAPSSTGYPLRVEYGLTTLGTSLYRVVGTLKVWAERQIVKVTEARAAYDQAKAKIE